MLAPQSADPIAGLLDAMRSAGLDPTDPSRIVADGTLHRFHVAGDKPGTLNGWYSLHGDHGVAGTWKGGATCTWSAKATARMSRTERDAFYSRVRQDRAEAQRQREDEQRQAAGRAANLWAKTRPASPLHPYLVRKRIGPGNARQADDLLVLAILDLDGHLHGLQYVAPDGAKRMLSGTAKRGHFILTAGTLPANCVLIGEGWATCMTVATQYRSAVVLAAIDAGNLASVAHGVRSRYPDAQIIIAADDDRLTDSNPGLTKARAAAAAVGGRLIRPEWPPGSPLELSDFNDLATWMTDGTEAAHA